MTMTVTVVKAECLHPSELRSLIDYEADGDTCAALRKVYQCKCGKLLAFKFPLPPKAIKPRRGLQ